MKSTQKNVIYMANAKILRWGPNTTYIPLARVGVCVWSKANFMFRLGVRQILAFLDTNMLVLPTQIFALGEPPT